MFNLNNLKWFLVPISPQINNLNKFDVSVCIFYFNGKSLSIAS